jgi:exonuclease III
MRIINWNCNNGISNQLQINYFKSFKADIAIIPEMKEHNIELLSPDDYIWHTNNHSNSKPKGLGVLSFNGFKLRELERDPDMEIFIPAVVSKNEFSFNLLAVWNFYSACKQGRFMGVEGEAALEYVALSHYKKNLSDPALIVGDWNQGPTFAVESYLKILKILDESKMVSLSHYFHKYNVGEEDYVTFKHPRGNLHILDHIFGSEFFKDNMTSFHIDSFSNVILSDHAPMVLDVEI